MKLTDLVVHLASQMPRHTDKFHDVLDYTTVTVGENGLVTVVCATPHGLESGAYITLSNVKVKRRILDYTHETPGVAFIEVDSDHDLTLGWQKEVEISGATEDVFNGKFELVDVPNRRFFNIKVPVDAPDNATGSDLFLHEVLEIGLDGAYFITVLDENTFTFQIDPNLPVDLDEFDGIIARNQRVIGTVNIDRFMELYEKSSSRDYWAVVCMDDAINSKDRSAMSDALANSSVQSDLRSILIEPFSVYVFAPTTDQLASLEAVDFMYEEVRNAIYKSYYGWKPPTGLAEESNVGIQPTAHGQFFSNNAYYAHQFRFETYKELTQEDSAYHTGSVILPTRAFRDIILRQCNEIETTVLGKNINLDDIPLAPSDPFEDYGGD